MIAAYRVASLRYHKWLRNPHFISSDGIFVDENRWVAGVLYRLDEKWKRNKLVWAKQESVPPEFKELARKYTPTVLSLIQAFHIRRLLYHVAGSRKRHREFVLYTVDTWC